MNGVSGFFSGSKGFTLVEVVVVMGVLCLGLLSVARIYPLGFKVIRDTEKDALGAFLGQRVMEEIRRDGYHGLSEKYSSSEPGYGGGQGEFADHRGFYWQVEWWDTDVSDLRKIKLKITCPASSDEEEKEKYSRSLDFVTYLASREK